MGLKETVFIMLFTLSPVVADRGEELQKEIDEIKQMINEQVLKALDDLSTKAGNCILIGTRIVVIISYKHEIKRTSLILRFLEAFIKRPLVHFPRVAAQVKVWVNS